MRKQWRSLLGAVVGVGFLAWALHGISFELVWLHIRHANPWYLLGSCVAGTLIFPLRAPRWRIILSPVAEKLPLGILWRAIAIGMMGNNVLPARAGELARAFALSRETKRVPFSAAFASLAVDRIFDATCVLLLMALATLDPSLPKGETFGGYSIAKVIGGGAGLAFVAILGLYLIVFFTEHAILMWEWMARKVAPRFEERGRTTLLAFASGLAVLRDPARFLSAMAWAIAMWLMNALAFWLGFKAVGIEVSYSAALMLQGLIAIGVAVPALPGFFGVFEKFAQLGLGIYGIDRTLATSWAISYHILTFLPITIIGIYYFVTLGLKLSDMNASTEQELEHAAGAGMSAKVARVAAQAKLNLGLRILARERSGYHEIETLFARIALADIVTVRPRDEQRSLVVRGLESGPELENLGYRAAAAYSDATGWPGGFEIEIEKKIPVGGGLGGGSSDAGAVLRALNALAPRPVSDAELLRIALTLGADVPYLTSTEPLALAWGRGERMLSLPSLPERTVLLVLPGFAVSTAEAFGWIVSSRPADVPSPRLVSVAELTTWDSLQPHVVNDFEPVVSERYPEVASTIAQLRAAGATIAGMSGSGSTMFGVVPLFSDTAALVDALSGTVVPTRTVTRVAAVELVE